MSDSFPMWMNHPAFRGAVLSNPGLEPGMMGTGAEPLRFPPVLVHTEDQRLEYEAKGYAVGPPPDSKAFIRAREPVMSEEIAQLSEYPQWVSPPDGGDPVLVKNEIEHVALKDKWAPIDAMGKAVEQNAALRRNDLPKKSAWTPERKAAQSAKMKARHEAKKAAYGSS